METPPTTTHALELAIAIITYRRPELLDGAVRSVLDQLGDLPMDSRIIVVDNDPDQSARAVAERFASPAVRYVAEPHPGIPAARNAAIDAADSCRLLAFIDDDETPEPGWLNALVDSWNRWDCDAVAGPTVRLLDGSEDQWVRASGFFDRVTRPDGAILRGAPSGNLLLDLATVRQLGLRFDARFATTGGSDTFFTRQLTAAGGVIRWSENAVTTEPVPAARATRAWVLARDNRIGNAWSRVHLLLAGSRLRRVSTALWLAALAVKLSITGTVRSATGLVLRDLRRRSRGRRDLARARGLFVGLFGVRVEEYRRA